jgi:hypothetical protein
MSPHRDRRDAPSYRLLGRSEKFQRTRGGRSSPGLPAKPFAPSNPTAVRGRSSHVGHMTTPFPYSILAGSVGRPVDRLAVLCPFFEKLQIFARDVRKRLRPRWVPAAVVHPCSDGTGTLQESRVRSGRRYVIHGYGTSASRYHGARIAFPNVSIRKTIAEW